MPRVHSLPSTVLAFAGAAGLAGLSACAGDRGPGDSPNVSLEAAASALESVQAPDLMTHIDTLASDAYEGRAPATPGEEKTVSYLTRQFQAVGLAPGNPDGTYVQDVTLVGIRNHARGSIDAGDQTIEMRTPDNFMGVSFRDTSEVHVRNSDVVFVGYGVEAPEYNWDDYAGQDMSGKTLVMLVNDPPVRVDGDTALDPDMFNGKAMTYYGRWTYKYEVGAEKNAAAVIIVHETGPAGYPWAVVTGSWGPEQFGVAGGSERTPVKVESWITEAAARELFHAAGMDFDQMKEKARTPGFRPVPLNAKATFDIDMERRQVRSKNVVAKLPGSDPEVADQYVIYSAHWDHLGRDTTLEGDQIFNGALDNASGVAGLLELAQAYTKLSSPPRRSVLFLAVTGEEKGLLGAKYYAGHPLYPLEKTLADINMDGLNQWGPTGDVVVVGMGNSSLDDVLQRYADTQGRHLLPDPEPEKGYFYRSDHFEFAKKGVPALYTDAGTEFVGKPAGWGEEKRQEYVTNDYHKPSDEVKPDWDLSGAVQDLQLLFMVGYDVAQGSAWPTWREGNEFKATRDAMLGQ